MRSVAVVLLLILVACADPTSSTTTDAPAVDCDDPPTSERDAVSAVVMTVAPNPASPLEEVILTVSPTGSSEDSVVGVDAEWQCWDGSSWITTHVVYRGFGDHAGQTIPVNADFQIQVPSIGLAVGSGYPIVVPRVDPGLYRIEDHLTAGDTPQTGFVIVEVITG